MTPMMRWIILDKKHRRIAYDSFDRADSALSLGVADTGQTWTAVNGTWGISNNQAYVATNSGARNIAVLASGSADGIIEVKFSEIALYCGLCFRVTDVNNLLRFTMASATTYQLRRIAANVQTDIAVPLITPTKGDVLKVILRGANIKCYVNGHLCVNVTDTFNSMVENHGIFAYNSVVPRFDNFKIEAL